MEGFWVHQQSCLPEPRCNYMSVHITIHLSLSCMLYAGFCISVIIYIFFKVGYMDFIQHPMKTDGFYFPLVLI